MKIAFGVKFIIWFHGEDLPVPGNATKSKKLELSMAKFSSFIICNSGFTKDRFKNVLPLYDKEIILCYPGVEEKYFLENNKNDNKKEKIKKQWDLYGKKIVYTIARLDKRKGHDKMIEAMDIIQKRIPNAVYLIGGKGPEKEKILKIAKKYGIEEKIIYVGLVDSEDMIAYHQVGDVFAMPNRTLANGDSEGFGIVFLEANACNNPVIGGNNGGALDSVVNSVTGFLVDPNNPKDIAEKICYLLEHQDEANRIGENGKKRVREKFRWPVIARDFEEKLYNAVSKLNLS